MGKREKGRRQKGREVVSPELGRVTSIPQAENSVNLSPSQLTHPIFSLVLITFSLLSRLWVYYLSWALQLLWPDFAGCMLPLTKLPPFSFAQCRSFKFKYKLYCITVLLKANQGFPLCQDETQIPNLRPLPHSSLTILGFMPLLPRTEALVDEFSLLSKSLTRLGTVSTIPLFIRPGPLVRLRCWLPLETFSDFLPFPVKQELLYCLILPLHNSQTTFTNY